MRKLVLTVSGIARGDPAQAAIGVVLADKQGKVLAHIGKTLGKGSQETAEYKAILEGLRLAAQYQPEEVVVFVDSQQIANQILGVLPPREPALQYLNRQVQDGLRQFPRWRVSYVDQDVCRVARRLAEQALYEERQVERERSLLRQEILSALDLLSLDELRRTLSFLQSLQATRS
ncbi:MAG: reverse transcriptase-like protein [Candidatus Bipolaricaulota bacterium]|nr:reverse transcriptase-like protein [Candidatus Bipolaricaulota bacterium]MDW8126557.1 reverse transcriptase-like protein [Candidatus Bipolaricaulota bacterium]